MVVGNLVQKMVIVLKHETGGVKLKLLLNWYNQKKNY